MEQVFMIGAITEIPNTAPRWPAKLRRLSRRKLKRWMRRNLPNPWGDSKPLMIYR